MASAHVKPGESSTSTRPKPASIPLYLIDGVATVWDAQVAATLHVVHSVSGLRAGSLPGVAQQNGFLGLPITLMQEETALLLRLGVAHLVPVLRRPGLPTPEEVERHAAERRRRIQAAEEGLRRDEEKRKAEARARFERGGEAAREKREARARAKAEKERARQQAQAEVGGEAGEDGPNLFGPPDTAASADIPPAGSSRPKPGLSGPTTTSDAIPDGGPWTSPGHFHIVPALPLFPSLTYGPPILSVPHELFPFPTTPRDHALVDTFASLHAQGYRMGLGPRFGGEYLVYPGDYLRYHAHFTSQVIVRDEPIRPAEIVAWGRLGTGTKKAGLLCCWDDGQRSNSDHLPSGEKATGEVQFYSLEWANFG